MSTEIIQKIYLACAEGDDEQRAIERAYIDRNQAEAAAKKMANELKEHMGWKMEPHVEELDLVSVANKLN